MKKYVALILALLLLLSCVGCGGQGGNDDTTAGKTENTYEAESDSKEITTAKEEDTTEKVTEKVTEEITTEKITEEITTEQITEEITTEEETEEMTEEDKTVTIEYPSVPEIDGAEAALPKGMPMMNYICGDGMSLDQYFVEGEAAFYSACAHFATEGFERYCYNKKGNSIAATYTKGDEYYSLFYLSEGRDLYIGHKESGALDLPAQTLEYEKLIETTVTQGYSKQINGMTYVFHLADDSFIIVDGGYATDAENLYKTLCALAGRDSDFHIRAWFMSHAHGDHYPAFGAFGDSYADKVTLDCFMYSPLTEESARENQYLTGRDVLADVEKYEGARAVQIHAGMVFQFADMKVEVLYTPEYIYKDYAFYDINESSLALRFDNGEGSFISLGDCFHNVSNFLIKAYGDTVKSDMLQVSHHGVEQATIELYKLIDPSMAFWPCNEDLLSNTRGTTTKQYLLSCPTIYEHVLHGYGNVTRPMSYRPEPAETADLLNGDFNFAKNSHVGDLSLENGVLKYTVKVEEGASDPFIYAKLSGLDTENYNALRLVVRTTDYNNSNVYVTFDNMKANAFVAKAGKTLGTQGEGENGEHTLLVYFGNIEGYQGSLNGIRIDIGTGNGQVVEILSAELFYIDIDEGY